jgi:hypothetical protein
MDLGSSDQMDYLMGQIIRYEEARSQRLAANVPPSDLDAADAI